MSLAGRVTPFFVPIKSIIVFEPESLHTRGNFLLGSTSHREIAVAILAELVQLRAAGALGPHHRGEPAPPAQAVDPVCGMTVAADDTTRPFVHDGVTYHFCSAGCRGAFEKDPAAHLSKEARC